MEYQIRTDRPPDKGHIETAIKAWLRASPMQPMGRGVLPSTELFPQISPSLWATSSTPATFGSSARPLPGRPAAPPRGGTAGRARGVVTAPAHNPFSSHQMQTAGEITIAPGIHLRQLSQMGSRHQHVFVLREKSLLIVQQGGMHSRWVDLGHGWHQPVVHPLPTVKPHANQAGPNLLSEVARWSGLDVGRMSTWQKLLWAAAHGVGQVNAELMQVVEDLLTWEGILSLAVIGGLLAIPVVGEIVLVGLAGVAIYDLLRNVSALFMQYWETAQSARTLGQLEQAGKYFAQALVRGLLDLLAVVAGGAAVVRSVRTVQVWRSGGKPVLRTALELVAEWARQLWGRLRGGTKQVTEWVKKQGDVVTGKDKPKPADISRTQPSGKPDPNAKPRGPRAKQPASDKDPANKRSAEGEDRAADVLAQHGYDVEQVPPSKEHGKKQADYKVGGREMDCVTPAKNTSVRNVWDRVRQKVEVAKQTERVVLNLEDWNGDVAALKKQFADWPIEGLKEVIIITKDGSVQHIFP